ncbi:MAG: SET domain-containing protein, partial [Candidatus Paceibacterota bacterium]
RTRAGLGLITECDLQKGDLVIEYTGERISNDEANARANRYLFEINDTWTLDGSSRTNLARYINHSCRPNCEAEVDEAKKRIFIYARKKVKKGEELTYDYGKDHFNEYIKPKGCKCEKCHNALCKRLPAI